MMNFDYGGGMMYGNYFFGWIYQLLFIVILVLIAIWLFQKIKQNEKRERR